MPPLVDTLCFGTHGVVGIPRRCHQQLVHPLRLLGQISGPSGSGSSRGWSHRRYVCCAVVGSGVGQGAGREVCCGWSVGLRPCSTPSPFSERTDIWRFMAVNCVVNVSDIACSVALRSGASAGAQSRGAGGVLDFCSPAASRKASSPLL